MKEGYFIEALQEKRSQARIDLAKQLKEIRNADRKVSYNTYRDLHGYIEIFRGLERSMEYIHTNNIAAGVADVGAGDGFAAGEMATSQMAQNLTVLATGLILGNESGQAQFHVTPAETLAPIPDSSLGGILASFSIMYTTIPEQVVHTFDKKLAKGGFVKATFRPRQASNLDDEAGYNSLHAKYLDNFLPFFQKKGYDFATLRNVILKDDHTEDIVLAVKPGIPTSITAEKLLLRDLISFERQLKQYPRSPEYLAKVRQKGIDMLVNKFPEQALPFEEFLLSISNKSDDPEGK